MINKDNIISHSKNKGITPKRANEALENLPYNFVVLTYEVLKKWHKEGKIDKIYTKVYISNVKTGRKGAFNKDIMEALISVGSAAKKEKENYGRITKKASPSN